MFGTRDARPWALAGLSGTLVALPFLFVTFPPATDLPQHLAQIHLLREVIAGRASELAISWWTPNNLVYLLLGATSLVAAPPLSGRLALLVIALAWVATAFHLAARRGRPAANAVLASVFVFNTSLYWGFVTFLVGWPVFGLWLVASLRPLTRQAWGRLVGLSALLYAAHALWFLMGALWLAVAGVLVGPRTPRHLAARLSALAPVGLVAAAWYRWLAATREARFDISAHWGTTLLERLDPRYLMPTGLGGVRGPLEAIVGIGVLAWLVAGIWTHRRDLGRAVDPALLTCAGLLWAFVLVAPDKYMNTIFFGARWVPCAAVCLVLGLPAPRVPWPRLAVASAIGLLVLLVVVTGSVWRTFERTELSGLAAALDALPRGQRVLGLDFVRTSVLLRRWRFVQTFAYAQPMKGATLNFSFTEHASGIVRSRTPSRSPWTPGLEWYPERVRAEDLGWFDYLLVNGRPAVHEALAANSRLQPVTREGRWRLYRVVR